MSGNR